MARTCWHLGQAVHPKASAHAAWVLPPQGPSSASPLLPSRQRAPGCQGSQLRVTWLPLSGMGSPGGTVQPAGLCSHPARHSPGTAGTWAEAVTATVLAMAAGQAQMPTHSIDSLRSARHYPGGRAWPHCTGRKPEKLPDWPRVTACTWDSARSGNLRSLSSHHRGSLRTKGPCHLQGWPLLKIPARVAVRAWVRGCAPSPGHA